MDRNQDLTISIPFINKDDIQQVPQTKSAYSEANFVSKIFFLWAWPLLKKSQKVVIEPEMIDPVDYNEQAQALYAKFQLVYEKNKEGNHGLTKSLLKTFKKKLLIAFSINLFCVILQMLMPFLIRETIAYIGEENKDVYKGVYLVLTIIFSRILITISSSHSLKYIRTLGYEGVSAVSMALLSKSFFISLLSNKKHTSGQIINLMQVDTMKMQFVTFQLSGVLFMPLQIAIAIYMLFDFIGISFLAGMGVIILTCVFNYAVGRQLFSRQKIVMANKDKRTKCANEIFSSIKFIKVNALEEFFVEKLLEFRKKEDRSLKTNYTFSCLAILSVYLSPMLVLNATFGMFIGLGNNLTPANTFAIISLFQVLQGPLIMLPIVINGLIQANVSFQRIHKFLTTEELMNNCIKKSDYPVIGSDAVKIENGTFFWGNDEPNEDQKKNQKKVEKTADTSKDKVQDATASEVQEEKANKTILNNINLTIKQGQMITIVGDVGSGKSSIIQSLLGEMLYDLENPPKITINGKIAYVSQKAWIQNETVKENILFGQAFDEDRYKKALKYSCLEQDIKILIKGDQTMIGEKGVNLSGGQKARISLARAIYSGSDIYLLDDPISAVDVHVGKYIMHNCLNGHLKNTTRILVTHALNYCQYTDYIYLMENGEIVESGTFNDIQNSQRFQTIYNKFYKSKKEEEEKEEEAEEKLLEEYIEKEIKLHKQQTSIASRHEEEDEKKEESNNQKDEIDDLMILEDRNKGNLSFSIIKNYIQFNGGIFFLLTMTFFLIIWTSAYLGQTVWMAQWTSESSEHPQTINNIFYLEIYTSLSLTYGLFVFFRSLYLVLTSCSSATKIHNKMVNCLIYAPQCSFFERVPLGRILNRFTKDQNVMDAEIYWNMNWFLSQFCLLLANSCLNVYASSIYIIIPIVLYFIFAWYLQRLYMACSRELYRLESISKSPILSFFSESIIGTSIIRAFNREINFLKKHSANLDINRKIYNQQVVTYVWFQMTLGLTSLIVNASAIIFCIFFSSKNAAFAGLVMTYAGNMDQNITQTVAAVAAVENGLVSLERMIAYTKVKPEQAYSQLVKHKLQGRAYSEKDKYITNWPSEGKIQFQNYSVQYRENLPPALSGLSFTINPREKIGVVGRTGAGKSTITLTLLRILEAMQGQIIIDGIDISTLSLQQLRQQITMIMQDATLFDGTLRDNIDPLKKHTDDEINRVIESCVLTDLQQSRDGLNTHISDSGENLSAGEKQLVCIARAVLKQSPIVLIDEATANIDIETEHKIQETILKSFKDCTVITIAHRINTILHCDKILVVDKGKLKEFGETKELLQDQQSVFHSIYEEALKEQKRQ